ncbi:hypothetical protein PN36_32225 [Candidatus Thiomargarita nelsonii]|uniref:RecF/RecN/SMC N-terminal domain-containing protein n=1 Tax=Candidatus Thiomargarita nelsonii TaxID=1003181 RepID=A0A4E0RLK2_9GAMM|nr:hypothetical protein PN36_32225 [Candidatus Thiomargarita nelsonii]
MLKKIQLTHFRSFFQAEVEIKNINVLIGGNGSGKSNFINAEKFCFWKSHESPKPFFQHQATNQKETQLKYPINTFVDNV